MSRLSLLSNELYMLPQSYPLRPLFSLMLPLLSTIICLYVITSWGICIHINAFVTVLDARKSKIEALNSLYLMSALVLHPHKV